MRPLRPKPIHPIILQGLVEILHRDFGSKDPEQTVKLAVRLIGSLRSKDMDIIRGNWMDYPEILERRDKPTWETAMRDAEEWIDSPASPLNRPELR